jgi:flagellin
MSLTIPTNVASLEAQKNLARNQAALQTSFNRLSSGFRINSAADDAAGLAISESMKTQIRSYVVSERNANDAISMVQTAEGALGEVQDIAARMRELSVQASNGSFTSTDRSYMDTEYTQLKQELTRIQGAAKFNGKQLLQTTATSIVFQVGLNNTSSDQLSVTFGGFALTTLVASTNKLAGTSASSALAALSIIDGAMTSISTQRAKYGASMNRLGVVTSSIQTMRLNISAANSRIRDVDVAEETSMLARNQVLAQAGVSVLSQANQIPSMAMSLLGR